VDTLKATGALTVTSIGTGGVNLDLNGQAVTITALTNIKDITSGTANGRLALPDGTLTVPKLTVGASDITVTSTTTTGLTVTTFSTSGAGKLVLPAETVSFTASGGGGKIAYMATPASLTLSSNTGLTLTAPAGPIAGAASVTGALEITGAATFGDALTAEALTVGGDLEVTKAAILTGTAAITEDATFKDALTAVAVTVDGNLKVTGAASLGGNLTVDGTADFNSTLTNTAASVATFNGVTTVTDTLTTGNGGLTIAGTGAVALIKAPTLTNGLIVTNSAGVTMPSVGEDGTIPVTNSIVASGNGKVIFGTPEHSVTIEKATLASNGTAKAKVRQMA
jgi:hypothetical protein